MRCFRIMLQLKIIKYNHLIANNVIFYNVFNMSIILQKLQLEGYEITDEILERLSPYIRNHINRFGKYNIIQIKSILGHSNIMNTLIYVKYSNKDLQESIIKANNSIGLT
jgi:hypothetical protein